LSAGAGAELLVLCETITADGSVTADEAEQLRAWLDDNASTDLPAVQFLAETVNRILADGHVTPDERRELHQALERVLPPETRQQAKQRRVATETVERARNEHVYGPTSWSPAFISRAATVSLPSTWQRGMLCF
jgi:hypothetical protein